MDRKKIRAASGVLLTDRIWTFDFAELSKAKQRLFKLFKLIRIVLEDFGKKRMGFQCVALSYFSALAFIPLLAVIFAITNGLGLADKVLVFLENALAGNTQLITTLGEKATNIINVAQSGPVGWFSAALFLWTILWMMFQVERVFNNVWGVEKVPRKLYTRVSFYLLTTLLLPFMLVIFGAGIVFYSNAFTLLGLDRVSEIAFLPKLLGWLGFYVVTVLTLSVMYKFIPALPVRYRSALIAALVAGTCFVIFQFLYLQTQMFVTRLNGVYGTIAAVPLFLIWLNYSWQIVIYGAQLSFAIQNVNTYNLPDDLTFIEAVGADRETRMTKRRARP